MDKLLDIILYLLQHTSHNVGILVIGILILVLSIMIFMYFIIANNKIAVIHKKYFAEIMDFIDDQLYEIYNIATNIMEEEAIRRSNNLTLSNIGNPNEILQYQVTIGKQMLNHVILVSTRDRMKTAIHQNGFYNLTGKVLDNYKKKMSKRFLNKNRNILDINGFNNYSLLALTDDERFNAQSAYNYFSDIVDEEIRLKKLEKQAINKIYTMPLKIWCWFKTKDKI